jgi:hypothetical protein
MAVEKVTVLLPSPPAAANSYASLYRMPQGPGHYFGRPDRSVPSDCGRKHVIAFLMELSIAWSALHPRHPFGIGDIFMGQGHVSHWNGTAVDIFVIHQDGLHRYFLENKVTWPGVPEFSAKYDSVRTTQLAAAIAGMILRYGGAPAVYQFLYNDTAVRAAVPSAPPITPMGNHDEHIHLTFRGPMLAPAYYDGVLGLDIDAPYAADDYLEMARRLVAEMRYLMYGSTGLSVEALQALLNKIPASQLAPLEVDGQFGPKTTAKVQEFQRRNNLVPDGVVGPQTKQALAQNYNK